MTTDEESSAPKRVGFFRRKRKSSYQPWDEARQRETAAGLAVLAKRRRLERDERQIRFLVSLWPVGIGIVLAAFSPLLKALAESSGPWAMPLIFPFVVLADRPEIKAGPITHSLSSIMLFAQFPIEGLLAKIILRRPVMPLSVAIQVLLFHFLGIVEVWMLNGFSQPNLHP